MERFEKAGEAENKDKEEEEMKIKEVERKSI